MAQVARAPTAGGRRRPARAASASSVQFRGMGVPEQEITVTGHGARGRRTARVIVDTVAEQGGNQIVRNAEAELRPPVAGSRQLRASRGRPPYNGAHAHRATGRCCCKPSSRRHVELGQPVGSKWLPSTARSRWGPSTIRNELAALEEQGLLAHPHTSAGRVPTDAGYRYYVDSLLHERRARARRPAARAASSRSAPRGRRGDARRRPRRCRRSRTCSRSSPRRRSHTATIRHVEVLLLQPQVAMVVVITSTGGVTKRVFTFDGAGRPGPRRLGRELPERAPRGHRPRRADARTRGCRAPSCRSASAAFLERARARVHRAGRDRRGHALRRRRRAPARASTASRTSADQRR